MSGRKNTLWNLAGAVVPLTVAVFSIPYLLNRLGSEGFGVLTLVWALIGYVSLFDFGIGRALTYELGRRSGSSIAELSSYLRAGLNLTLLSGFLGAIAIAILVKPLTSNFLGIGIAWKDDATLAFLVAAVGIIPTTATSGLRGALEGLDMFRASNLNKMTLGALTFALPAWSVAIHGNQIWIATLYIVCARLVFTLVAAYQVRHVLMAKPSDLSSSRYKSLMNYGFWLSVTGIVGPLMVYGDRFFVTAAVGIEVLAQYAIPQEGLQRLLIVPAAITGALLPKIAGQQISQIASAYRDTLRQVTALMFGICALAAAFAYPALSFWISQTFADRAIGIALVLIIGIWFNSMALVPYTVIHALGKPKITAIFHTIELIFYMLLLMVCTAEYGILGAALAWTARVIVDFILMYVTANRILLR